MLAPAKSTVRQTLPVLDLVQSSRWIHYLARVLFYGLILSILGLALLPWQQTSRGTGRVVAFDPQKRQQTITSPSKGVVGWIAPNLVEGTVVKKGDKILEIEPIAANMVEQINSQVANAEEKFRAAQSKVTFYEDQRDSYREAQKSAVAGAQENVNEAQSKLEAEQEAVRVYESKLKQAQLNYTRQRDLFEAGIRASKDYEEVRMKRETAEGELAQSRKKVSAAEDGLASKIQELEYKRQEAQAKIDYAEATLEQARGEAALAEKDIRDVEMKQDELDRRFVNAPNDGTLFRLTTFEQGQQIKEGAELFTIVPDSEQHAVELYVSGNDLPLMKLGSEVRLQFEGWPAVQFVGWPSISVGSFGGVISAIDATDDGQGQFRVLVTPIVEADWPEASYLRQGVRANGWVMLGKVPLWFELWRQLNGFPPTVSKGSEKEDKSAKMPKVPK